MSVAAAEKEFIAFRPAEIKTCRHRKRLPGPQWMAKNLYVPIGSRKGVYSHKNNPAMYGVLDWATRHHVRTVVLAKGIQVGGTVAFYGLLLREGDYSSDAALVVMADEKTGKKLVKKRLQPMIDKSPALASIKSADPDDTTLYSITLANGYTIDIGWASSEMSVSSESYRVVILDEISKYKVTGNIEDAKARTTVYPDTCRIWILSSPGIDSDDPDNRDPLMVEAEACDVMLEFLAKCPDCGGRQVMRFDQFKWPEQKTLDGKSETDPKAIRRNKSAWYECEHCGSHWNDYKRDKAVLVAMEDGWQPTDGDDIEFPQSVYIHFPSWLSPFVSLSTIVADWLEAQGDEEKLRKWHNRHGGVSYKYEQKKARPHAEMLRLIDPHLPRNIVPRDINCILIIADAQKIGAHYDVVAFGWGRDLGCSIIDRGYVEHEDHLNIIAERDWFDADGRRYRARAGFIDSGGGTDPHHPKHSRTHEIYNFCVENPFWHPLKGKQRQTTPVSWTRLDYFPGREGRKVPIPAGLMLYTLDTTYYKNVLSRKLQIEHGNPGAIHLNCGLTIEEMEHWSGPHSIQEESRHRWTDYVKQLCAETQNDSGHWENPKKLPNHHWDTGVYRYAVADLLYLGDEKPEEETGPQETQRPIEHRQQKSRRW